MEDVKESNKTLSLDEAIVAFWDASQLAHEDNRRSGPEAKRAARRGLRAVFELLAPNDKTSRPWERKVKELAAYLYEKRFGFVTPEDKINDVDIEDFLGELCSMRVDLDRVHQDLQRAKSHEQTIRKILMAREGESTSDAARRIVEASK